MADLSVSVVLPAYNEEDTIRHTVEATQEALTEFLDPSDFEILIAEDGCDDRTPELAAQIAHSQESVRHIHATERLGRGGALEYAFSKAHGEVLVYFDTDLATDLTHLEELIESIRTEEFHIATGSRRLRGEEVNRPIKRSIASNGFNNLVRLFLGSHIRDHQCGFKAFNRTALEEIVTDIEDDHWFWDTELLIRAQRAGYRIKEFPVTWEPQNETKVDLIRDILGMGSGIIRLWWQLSVRTRINRRVTLTAGTLLVLTALVLMTQYLDPTEVILAIQRADPRFIGMAIGLYLLSWPIRGIRYRDILLELGYQQRIGFLTGAIFISQTGNLVFPARAGDAVRAYIIKVRQDIPYPSGFASLAIERVYDLLTISALAGITFIGLAMIGTDLSLLTDAGAPAEARQSGHIALLGASLVAILAIVLVATIVVSARTNTNLIHRSLHRVSKDAYVDKVATVVEQFVSDVQLIADNRRAFLLIGTSSILVWVIDIVTAILIFLAFGVNLPLQILFFVGVFAVSIGNLAKVLPLSPGGVGLYEGAFSLLVVALTPVGWSVAIAAAILDHAVKNLVTIGGGIGSTLLFNISLTSAVKKSREIDREKSIND